MKKGLVGGLGFLVLLAAISSAGFGWERATHAYIADLLKRGGYLKDVQEIYASTTPDIFNYTFAPPGILYRDWLYQQTHFKFMKLVDEAKGPNKDAAAGFASHNNVWGADVTAHTHSLTLDPKAQGYIITKAKIVDSILMGDPGYAGLLGSFPDVRLEICHDIVEAAGDVILKNYDPTIGAKLMAIGRERKPEIRDLLVEAYAHDLSDFSRTTLAPLTQREAKQFIRDAEDNFRMGIIGYGYLLQGDDATLIANIVDQFKSLAGAFLSLYGIPDPGPAALEALITGALNLGIAVCQGDYMTEVLATADYVKDKLKAHKIK